MRQLLLFVLLTTAAFGQNSQWQRTVFSSTGKPAVQATITVCASSESDTNPATCNTPITIYSTPAGAAQANPFSTDTVGNYSFYAPAGYVTVKETYLGASYIYKALLGLTTSAPVVFTDSDSTTSVIDTLTGIFHSTNTSGDRTSSVGVLGEIFQDAAGQAETLAGNYGMAQASSGAGSITRLEAMAANSIVAGGTVTSSSGVATVTNISGGTTTFASGFRSEGVQVTGGTVTNTYGAKLDSNSNAGGTVTNNYGLYVGAQAGVSATAANNYEMFLNGTSPFAVLADGSVGVGTSSFTGAAMQIRGPTVSAGGHTWLRIDTAAGRNSGFIFAENGVDQGYIFHPTGGSELDIANGVGAVVTHFGTDGSITAGKYGTNANCSGVGTSANPSVAACAAAPAGSFSCATAATGGTCTVNTTAVTANSQIFVTEDETLGAKLGVTCNTSTTVIPTSRLIAARVAATSFTINLGTVTTNPACFSYFIVN